MLLEAPAVTSPVAAVNFLTGLVIGQCLPRHHHDEFLKFLKTIDKQTTAGLQIHLILDNDATHKHSNVQTWLAKRPRFHLRAASGHGGPRDRWSPARLGGLRSCG